MRPSRPHRRRVASRIATSTHLPCLVQPWALDSEQHGSVWRSPRCFVAAENETAWIEQYQQLWDARFDALENVVEELRQKEKMDGRKSRE
jgi:hypothetical protein